MSCGKIFGFSILWLVAFAYTLNCWGVINHSFCWFYFIEIFMIFRNWFSPMPSDHKMLSKISIIFSSLVFFCLAARKVIKGRNEWNLLLSNSFSRFYWYNGYKMASLWGEQGKYSQGKFVDLPESMFMIYLQQINRLTFYFAISYQIQIHDFQPLKCLWIINQLQQIPSELLMCS